MLPTADIIEFSVSSLDNQPLLCAFQRDSVELQETAHGLPQPCMNPQGNIKQRTRLSSWPTCIH